MAILTMAAHPLNEAIMLRTVTNSSVTHSGFVRGIAFVTYSFVSYLVGFAGQTLLILATVGLLPLGMFTFADRPLTAVVVDIGLLLLFGLQHSVMARASFKQELHRILPAALERSTFVWTSGVALGAVVLFWQPISGVIWQTSGVLSWILLAGGVLGWTYLFAATFAINHWDLFGFRQSWLAARGQEYKTVPFKEHWMYRHSRHPIMLGTLIGIWSLRTMTATHLFLSGGLTVYIVIGVYIEERDLTRQWGQSYLNYKRRVGALFSFHHR
jgi:protein-S-isoprenylcysteine O-methyltransferase Ste14